MEDSKERTRLLSFLANSTLGASALTALLALVRIAVEGPSAVALVLASASGAFAIQHLALRGATGPSAPLVATISWAFPLTGLAGIASMSWAESGLHSEALYWLPSVPLLAVISAGRRGVVACTLLATAWVAFLVLDRDSITSDTIFSAMGLMGAVAFGGVVGLSYEASRRAEAERLRAALRDSEAASEAKTNFLAAMSHELRTPLNAIIGFSDLIEKGKRARPDDQQSYAERINRNGRHLLQLVNDVLDVSKVEAGKLEVELESVDINALISGCIGDFESMAQASRITLLYDAAPAPAPVVADPLRLKQIVANLVSNAVKFTEAGGLVRVELVTDPKGAPQRVDVIDTGPGIAPERTKELFELFHQLEQTTARPHEGTGLGLALARRLGKLMGMGVDVVSVVGKGSTFSVYVAEDAPVLETHRPPRGGAGEA